MSFGMQVAVLFILAIPIACVAWTVTHEEIFREWLDDWRGYVIAFFALVFVANVHMSAFGELRLEIRQDRQEIAENDEIAEIRHRRAGDRPAH
jgi:hypothetical protein